MRAAMKGSPPQPGKPVRRTQVDRKAKSIAVSVVEGGATSEDALERIPSLAAMLDLAGDAIVAVDFEGMKIQFWNKGAESLYQFPRSEALGKDFTSLVAPLDHDWESLHRVLLERGEWQGEQRLRRPDKTGIVVRARSTLMRDASGRPQSILHIATDITEHKRIERQLLRAQRLESIGTLASGLAHDLTNILSPIILSTPLLAADVDPTVRKTIIDTIRASARRGGAIVQQILTFARGIEGERLLIDLNHLLRELLNIMEQTFPRSLSLSCHGTDDLWPVVGDPTQLHQVLLNLSINARDAMPHGGRLTVTAENIVVDDSFAIAVGEARPGRYVVVQVSDTGVGIPTEIVEKIFDPFFTTKSAGEGTGLGLSTALGIVKSHSGFLMVESEIGHGTRFKVFIPASAEGAAIPANVEPVVQRRGHGETILLVDDESAFLVVISALLQEAGYKVLPSSDGTHALAAYMKHRRDVKLVITDAIMPFLDGASLTRALRQIDPRVKVIGISGHANDGQVNELRSLKLSGFLAKPFDGPTLMAAVHRALHPSAHSDL